MTTSIGVPAEMADELAQFLSAESIDLSAVTDGPGAVQVARSDPEPQESGLDTLYAGGWISCDNARALAGKLAIAPREVGKLLDCLKVKIRLCVLGCFD